MKIYSDGKSRVLNGAFPKHFRLLNGEKEVPFIRTGRESIRISGELPVGDLLVDEIIRQKVAQPAKLDAQSLAIINKDDFDRIDILNKKLAINQEKMGEQMNALAEHEATLANLETKNAGNIELLSGQTASAVQMLKGAIEDTDKKNVAVQKALSQAIKETSEDLSDSLVAHETAKNPHRITKSTIGLEKVENIKPEDMPVSKATKKELDKKADKKDIAEVEKKLTEKSDKIVKGIERMNMLGGVGGNELPSGGKKGYVLAKKSNKTGDYEWSSAAGGVSVHNDLTGRDADKCHPISAIDGLQTALTTETTNRENSDNGLQSQIDAITASSDVKDIVGTHADLEDYDTSTLGNNDIIKVLQDETQNDQTTYYRWNSTTQTFSLIGAEGPYYTKSESNTLFQPAGSYVTTNTAQSITAQKTFESSTWNGGIKAKRTSSSGSFVVFENNGGVLGGIGMDGDSKPLCANSTASSIATLVRSGTHTNPATGSATKPVYIDSNGIAQECSNSIPTSDDYWTITTDQTSSGKKMINYTQASAQDNGFRVIAKSDSSSVGTTGAWTARVLIGNEKRTFLMGTARNTSSTTQSICGIGAHTWGSATSQTSAAWDNVYFQPDGSTGCYLGGNGWRGSSGWFRVLNNNSGNAAYRTSINTGTAASPTWKTVLPNQASGTSSVQIVNAVGTTHAYNYCASLGGTATANYGSSLGYNSSAGNYGVALGASAVASGNYSIQIGYGTNSTANTMSVGLSSSLNVQLLDASGEIPDARIKTTIARTSQIPTDNASLANGAGYITSSDIPVTDVTVGGTSVLSGGVAVVPAIPSTAADVGALPDSTKYGADLDLTGGTLQLLDQDGNALGNSVTVPDTANFVQKTGDTMTGKLSVKYGQANISVSNSNVTLGTNPASTSYSAVQFTDSTNDSTWQNTRLGVVESVVNTDGSTEMRVSAHKYLSGDTSQATISVKETAAGVASCSFPNTTCVDGQWVKVSTAIASGISGGDSYSNSFTVTDLPNDGHKYECVFMAGGRSGTTSGNALQIWVGSSECSTALTALSMTRTSSYVACAGAITIPVGTDRKVTLALTNTTGTASNVYLQIKAYRRIGTNS